MFQTNLYDQILLLLMTCIPAIVAELDLKEHDAIKIILAKQLLAPNGNNLFRLKPMFCLGTYVPPVISDLLR